MPPIAADVGVLIGMGLDKDKMAPWAAAANSCSTRALRYFCCVAVTSSTSHLGKMALRRAKLSPGGERGASEATPTDCGPLAVKGQSPFSLTRKLGQSLPSYRDRDNHRPRGEPDGLWSFRGAEPGVEGLVHISEMSWSKRLRHPSKILKIDDHVDVGVLEVDMPKRRISLSLKASLPDPWTTISEKFAVGAVVQGRVRNLTEFGAFVEIEDGVDGLIHLTNISWNRNIKHPSEILKKGQKVDAVVLALDPGNRRLALGLKQLEEDPWQSFFAKIHVGEMVHGKVSRQVSFGVFVELEDGIEGLCHVSEMENAQGGSGNAKLEVGSEHDFRIIRLSPGDRKIGLSMKEAAPPPPPPEPAAPKAKEPERLSTMAEALSSAGITP